MDLHLKCLGMFMVWEWWLGAQRWFTPKSTIAIILALGMVAWALLPRSK